MSQWSATQQTGTLPLHVHVAPRNSLGVGWLDVAQVIVHRMVEQPLMLAFRLGKSRRPDTCPASPVINKRNTSPPKVLAQQHTV